MDISRAANLIHFAISITWVRLYQSSIINSKAFSNTITIQFSIGFNDTVVRLYTDYESLCAGTYSITIYCGYSLDFIIGYFKAFSNAIFNFDSYGISIDFGGDNSKTSISSIAWFILMILLLQILKHFLFTFLLVVLELLVALFVTLNLTVLLLVLVLIILRLLVVVVLIALKTVSLVMILISLP